MKILVKNCPSMLCPGVPSTVSRYNKKELQKQSNEGQKSIEKCLWK